MTLLALLVAAPVEVAAEPGARAAALAWAVPGSLLGWPEAGSQDGMPRPLAGLVGGGWALRDGLGHWLAAGPPEAMSPAAWSDSAMLTPGAGAAWEGPAGALLVLHEVARPPSRRRTRAVFTRRSGGDAREETALRVGRGDERGWFRAGAAARNRGESGAMGLAGDHLWTAEGAVTRGPHQFTARYQQAGLGNRQREGGIGEGARGESGGGGWRWQRGPRILEFHLERSHEGRDSFGEGAAFAFARRDAATDAAAVTWRDSLAGGAVGVRALWRREVAVRVTPVAATAREAWTSDQGWLAVRATRGVGGGVLGVGMGVGAFGGVGERRQRLQAAPSLDYRREARGWSGHLGLGRVVTPVVTDLAADTRGWVQDAWAFSGQLRHGRRDAPFLEVTALAGRTAERALWLRYPVRDVSLRVGARRERGTQPLALVAAAAGIGGPGLRLEADGFASAAPEPREQPRVDPAVGARLALSTGTRLFQGDLALRLRIEGAAVGARDLEHSAYDGVAPRVLPAHGTLSASLCATLGDVQFGFRAERLEDRRRPQVWIDPATGAPALGPGRELVFELVWPLFD